MTTPALTSLPLHENAHTILSTGVAGSPGATLVQSAWVAVSSAASTNVTLGTNNPGGPSPGVTTAGNCLVVYIGENNTTTNPQTTGITLGGAAGNFAAAKTAFNNADANAEIWIDWNCAGGQTVVAVTTNGGSGVASNLIVYVEEWTSVVNSGTPLDQVSGANGSSTSPSSGATPTLSQVPELFTGCIAAANPITGPAAPWVNGPAISVGGLSLLAGHQVVSATTGLAYSGTITSAKWGAVVVSLKSNNPVPAVIGGAGTARISPGQPGAPGSGVGASRNSGLLWNVTGVAVSCSTNSKEATAAVYISYGIQSNTPDDFQGQTQTGSTGDTCTVDASLRPGDWITVIWSGGDNAAIATARIFGTVSPPGTT